MIKNIKNKLYKKMSKKLNCPIICHFPLFINCYSSLIENRKKICYKQNFRKKNFYMQGKIAKDSFIEKISLKKIFLCNKKK